MKGLLIGVAAGVAAFYLIDTFVIKTDESDPGFIQTQPGFGLDDIILGGGTYLVGHMLARMISR